MHLHQGFLGVTGYPRLVTGFEPVFEQPVGEFFELGQTRRFAFCIVLFLSEAIQQRLLARPIDTTVGLIKVIGVFVRA